MANIASAKKRARQSENNRLRNKSAMSAMRTGIKKVETAIEAGDKEAAQAAFKGAASLIDRVQQKGVIHANNAARKKSRLNKRVAAL